MVRAALEQGKHVFVEKPLCVSEAELGMIWTVYKSSSKILTVGFNRRFSRPAKECARFFEARREPLAIFYRVSAPALPAGHWTLDAHQGHGRLIGEVCHFVDFIQFLTAALPAQVQAWPLRSHESNAGNNFEARIEMDDGSVAHLSYLTCGASALPKERIEVHSGGRSAVVDDFRKVTFFDAGRIRRSRWLRQDKGHAEEVQAFIRTVRKGGPASISFASLAATTLATMRMQESLWTGKALQGFGCAAED
jgi:predicted dehydrogenase